MLCPARKKFEAKLVSCSASNCWTPEFHGGTTTGVEFNLLRSPGTSRSGNLNRGFRKTSWPTCQVFFFLRIFAQALRRFRMFGLWIFWSQSLLSSGQKRKMAGVAGMMFKHVQRQTGYVFTTPTQFENTSYKQHVFLLSLGIAHCFIRKTVQFRMAEPTRPGISRPQWPDVSPTNVENLLVDLEFWTFGQSSIRNSCMLWLVAVLVQKVIAKVASCNCPLMSQMYVTRLQKGPMEVPSLRKW